MSKDADAPTAAKPTPQENENDAATNVQKPQLKKPNR